MGGQDAWLGSMVRASSMGLRQKDNGVCLLTESGMVFAVSEERLSRKKHDNDYQLSMLAATHYAEINGFRLVSAALSSCGDLPGTLDSLPLDGLAVESVHSHHYAHALSAYWMSGFETSIVIVMDAGGSLLSSPTVAGEWWSAQREQTSVWIGDAGRVTLRRLLHAEPYDIGFGEWWRAFTYYLGWHTHTLTGNTMASAALGDDRYAEMTALWAEPSGTFGGQVLNNPRDPISMVKTALIACGITSPPSPRNPGERLVAPHFALARYLQESFTDALQRLVREESLATGMSKLCLSGGVAQNCVAAGAIAADIGYENLFVPVTAGDVGQPIGAALHAAQIAGAAWPSRGERVFLGPEHGELRENPGQPDIMRAAQRIARGGIVALVQGRSEFGPRALGHRTVLCDPLDKSAVERVKAGVKMRDDFMPLAPAIRRDVIEQWPNLARTETMTLAPKIPLSAAGEFGLALHADGTARIQVVKEGETMAGIIDTFERITGRRILINTSLNRRGAPIAESPKDAYEAFSELDVDGLLIGESWVER